MSSIFNTLLVFPIVNVLLVIYHLLSALHIPSALGFAIILLTVAIRFLLYPFTASQLKTSHKMQTITPHLKRLREQHKDNARQLQEETLALYREHGINPASGCVALLLQLPLLWALYAVLQHVVQLKPADIIAYVNTIAYLPALHLQQPWDTGFFGIPLGQSPSHLFPRFGILVFLIPVLTGLLQYFQSKLMFPATPPAEPKEKSTTADDFAQAFQKQSLYIFPVMIAFFSYSLPFGLSLYWNTFSVFGIIQQRQLQNVAKVPGSNTRAIPPKKTSRKK